MKVNKKNRIKKISSKSNATSEMMVKAIANGNNVEAYKLLEKRIREKVSEKIDSALNS